MPTKRNMQFLRHMLLVGTGVIGERLRRQCLTRGGFT